MQWMKSCSETSKRAQAVAAAALCLLPRSLPLTQWPKSIRIHKRREIIRRHGGPMPRRSLGRTGDDVQRQGAVDQAVPRLAVRAQRAQGQVAAQKVAFCAAFSGFCDRFSCVCAVSADFHLLTLHSALRELDEPKFRESAKDKAAKSITTSKARLFSLDIVYSVCRHFVRFCFMFSC